MPFHIFFRILILGLAIRGTAYAMPCIVMAKSKLASIQVGHETFRLVADSEQATLRLRQCQGMEVLSGQISVTAKHPSGDWRTLQLNNKERLTDERIAALKADRGGVLAVLDAMFHGDSYSKYGLSRSDEPSVPGKSRFPEVEIRLRDDARADEIRTLLLDVRGEITGGPGQLGIYRVALPEGNVTEAVKTLRASRIVESVIEAEKKP
jgi:hypothetical protein